MMNDTETPLSPGRAIDAWRHWFRDRRHARSPQRDGFAVTEWADTEAGITAVPDAADTLHPPHPLAG